MQICFLLLCFSSQSLDMFLFKFAVILVFSTSSVISSKLSLSSSHLSFSASFFSFSSSPFCCLFLYVYRSEFSITKKREKTGVFLASSLHFISSFFFLLSLQAASSYSTIFFHSSKQHCFGVWFPDTKQCRSGRLGVALNGLWPGLL